MRADWIEAVEVRAQLIRQWRSPAGEAYLRSFAESINIPEQEDRGPDLDPDKFVLMNRFTLEKAQSVLWVKGDMVDLFTTESEDMPPYALRADDLPDRVGFAMLEHDGEWIDINGNVMGYRAFSWAIGKGWKRPGEESPRPDDAGISMVFYSDKYSPVDWYMRKLRGEHNEPFVSHDPGLEPPDNSHSPKELRQEWERQPRFLVTHYDTWRFGDAFSDLTAFRIEGASDEANERAFNAAKSLRQQLGALWILLNHEIVMASPGTPGNRADRKLLARDYATIPTVTVVTLRRKVYVDRPTTREGVEGRHLTYRHTRRGHWRNHWWPKEERHKPTWIEPTVVGPDDAPLVTKTKVLRWVR